MFHKFDNQSVSNVFNVIVPITLNGIAESINVESAKSWHRATLKKTVQKETYNMRMMDREDTTTFMGLKTVT